MKIPIVSNSLEQGVCKTFDRHYGNGEETKEGRKYSIDGTDVFVNNDSLTIYITTQKGIEPYKSFSNESAKAHNLVEDISTKTGLKFLTEP